MNQGNYSSIYQLLDILNKVKKHLSAPSDVIPEPGTGHGPRGSAYLGPMVARMYGSGVESNVADKGDLESKANDPNQTRRPRISMDAATASPASKRPAVKKTVKKPSEPEKLSNWITSISR